MFKSSLHLASLLAFTIIGLAQAAAPPKSFSGTIVSVAGASITLQDKDAKTFVVQMTPGWTVSVNRTVDVGAIKPGSFIATTNTVVSASTCKSTEVRILERGYRPAEGTHAVSATNPNMMTHGTVKTVTATDVGMEVDVA